MKDEALKLALEALGEIEWSNNSQWQSDRAKVAIFAIKQAFAVPVQENAMIYKTFEQWMDGNFLEVKEPRKKAYSKDELLLVEMGWNYGYDAGRAVEQALDKKAENVRELGLDYEPVPENFIDALKFDVAMREWVGLTEDEVFAISNTMPYADRFDFAAAIEANLKEKNT